MKNLLIKIFINAILFASLLFSDTIILWEEDFESDVAGWNTGSGWNLTTDDYNSETHSMHSPNNEFTECAMHDLLSPVISLPYIGDDETMHFGFHLFADIPDWDSDEDEYLDDYYYISIMDVDATAWHSSGSDVSESLDGNSYWCGDEEVGGYLNSWLQFLDTPSFTVPSGGELTADMMWTIESYAGATVAGSCTDGWDAANVRISTDGGNTWALLHASGPGNGYDFDCGYGWIWNDAEYDAGGLLNHLAAGWGNNKDWHNASFDLSAYTGQDAIVRFAFASDPVYCTLDDSALTGFHIDNIQVSGSLECSPENNCETSMLGEFWEYQLYDFGGCDWGWHHRPGCGGWEEYIPGMSLVGNVWLDISDYSEKDIQFRVRSSYDGDHMFRVPYIPNIDHMYNQHSGPPVANAFKPINERRDCVADGPQGEGLYVDDIKIYKIFSNYFEPTGLTAEAGDGEASLSWYNMNASGTDDFVFDDDNFSNGITVTAGSAWAGERIDLVGPSTVNSVSVFNANEYDSLITIAAFGQFGSLFGNEPSYTATVNAASGEWTTVDVSWAMNNHFIIAHEFNGTFSAALDEFSSMGHSMVMLNAGWDNWSAIATANGLSDGEWGIRANISFDGAGVTYNLYRDGTIAVSGLIENSYTDVGLTNNTDYLYTVSATYPDGGESDESNAVEVTPFADTFHEESHDDGNFESEFNAGSGNFSAVRFSANSTGEDIIRFKWFQNEAGGAFYIKIFEDDGGIPGSETYSAVQASGNTYGWNDKDLTAGGLFVSGDFWIGTKEFSSSKSFGLDTSSDAGVSYQRAGSSGDWTAISGNLAYRVILDCGDNCDDEGCTNDAGDVNEDGIVNVLDVVILVGAVLGDSLLGCGGESADMSGDGIVNVLDVVMLVNLILNP